LIKNGVSVDAADEGGDTALDWAIYNHELDLVRKLIALGANVNHVDESKTTPLMYVATPLRGKGYYPETMTARNQIARVLIEHGANVNVIGPSGSTALHFAVGDRNPALIRILLAAGADPKIEDSQGYTPMFLAKSWGYDEAAKALEEGTR
jgi:ankyrin repeat protein